MTHDEWLVEMRNVARQVEATHLTFWSTSMKVGRELSAYLTAMEEAGWIIQSIQPDGSIEGPDHVIVIHQARP